MISSGTQLKGHYTAAVLLIVGGLLGSYLLAPGKLELGHIYTRTYQLDKAATTYQTEVDKGRNEPTIIVPLSHIYLQQGKVDDAIEVLETRAHDNDPKVLEELANAYQGAQRYYDQLDVLERLVEVEPTEQRLLNLSNHLNFLGENREQARDAQKYKTFKYIRVQITLSAIIVTHCHTTADSLRSHVTSSVTRTIPTTSIRVLQTNQEIP